MKKVSFDLEVYTFQIDFAHHVSNIVYIQWLEIGRLKLLEEIGLPADEAAKRGITPILVNTNIRYKQPIYFGDNVRMEVWVGEMKAASAVMEFRIYKNGDALAAEAQQTGLFINLETKKPYRITKEERALFEKFME
ncbi:MAG: acyl-CoA thioesterase [Chlorobi bacterium]|nr:acyl-CoA thioesterase [Chlorobiota bacterium]